MACNLKHVKSYVECTESPAGVSNYCMVVPLFSDYIKSICHYENKPEYSITAYGNTLKGFRIDFKSQTGQVTAEDNGDGSAWTVTGTGRVDRNEADMSYVSRTLSNLAGRYLVFFPTGKTVTRKVGDVDTPLIEWKVVGNEFGSCTWSVAGDSGAARGDDHGLTFTVTCDYQVYPTMYWYGSVAEFSPAEMSDSTSAAVTIEGSFGQTEKTS